MLSTAVINFSATARSTSLDLLKLFHHTNDVESYTAGQTIFSIGEPGGVNHGVGQRKSALPWLGKTLFSLNASIGGEGGI
jgi:hypothetical protein